MKKQVLSGLAIIIIFIFFILLGADCNPKPKHDFLSLESEVIQHVYDDDKNTVYIKVEKDLYGKEAESLNDIAKKKLNWEEKFPKKKVVVMTIVTGSTDAVSATPIGLLIQYENH